MGSWLRILTRHDRFVVAGDLAADVVLLHPEHGGDGQAYFDQPENWKRKLFYIKKIVLIFNF